MGRFARVVVCEKSEALAIESFQQDGALRGESFRRNRGQRHGVRFVDMEFCGLLEPFLEDLRRIVAQILPVQAAGGVFFSEIGEVHAFP